MTEETAQTESRKDFTEPKLVNQWLAEIKAYEKTYKHWTALTKGIVKRYRNEDTTAGDDGMTPAAPEFNILWSNVQTIGPIVYSRVPKASISRKWKDNNPIGRAAAVILERATQAEIDAGGFDSAMRGSRDDYLLSGRGQFWVRYVPTYGEEQRDKVFLQADTAEDGSKVYTRPDSDEPVEFEDGQEPQTEDGLPYVEEGEPYRPVIAECVKQEHVPWDRFGHTPAPCWEKVRGVWKGEPMTRDQLVKRFGKEKGDKIPLKLKVPGIADQDIENYGDVFKRALVYEVWDKTTGKVLWVVDGVDEPLDVIDDPLGLKEFFPCPPPLFGTTTTDSLIPVPDYRQYQAQAEQIDELTARLSLLIQAVRVAGVYAGEQNKEIEALVSRRGENKLIPVDNWAMFAEKGGLRGVIDWLPIENVVAAIQTLMQAREQLKNDVYELTGISDIVRGQGADTGPATTATENRIKGQYAGLRISDRQLSTEKHARDGVQIVAEIVAEQFSPETLRDISGWDYSDEAGAINKAYAEWEAAAQQAQAEYQQAVIEYQQSISGGAPTPEMTGGAGEPGIPPQLPAPPEPPQIPPPPPTSEEVFAQAVELLRSDRTRGFTIEIETDSMVLEDQQQEAENRTDLLEKVTGYLQNAPVVAQQFPALGPLLGEFLLWVMRGHKIGRTMEAHVEQAWGALSEMEPASAGEDQASQMAAEIEGQKVQVSRAKVEVDRAKAESAAQLQAQKQANDTAKAEAEAQLRAMEMQIKAVQAERDAAVREREIMAAEAGAKFDRLVKMLELKLASREQDAAERKNTVDAVIGAAQVDVQADAAQRAEETKRMQAEQRSVAE